jgi:hypothetical protein
MGVNNMFLRKPVQGDRALTVSNFQDDGSQCYHSGSGGIAGIVTGALQLIVGSTTYALTSADFTFVGFGFGNISVPSSIIIGANDSVQVKCLCNDVANSSNIETALAVNFKATLGSIKACAATTTIVGTLEEPLRIYLSEAPIANETLVNFKVNNTALNASLVYPQTNSSLAEIVFNPNGDITRTISANSATIFGTTNYILPTIIDATVLAVQGYYTFRLGYLEVIVNADFGSGGGIGYINYLESTNQVYLTNTFSLNDVITLESTQGTYTIKRNGVAIYTYNKVLTFTLDGSSAPFSPSTLMMGSTSTLTFPSIGSHTVRATFNNIILGEQILIKPCASALNDAVSLSTFATPYSGTVTGNDIPCSVGVTTYGLMPSTNFNGTVVFNSNGSYTFTFVDNTVSNASFDYRIFCDGVEVEIATVTFTKSCLAIGAGDIVGAITLLNSINILNTMTYTIQNVTGSLPTNYAWTLTHGTIIGGQGTDTITVQWDTTAVATINCLLTNCAGTNYSANLSILEGNHPAIQDASFEVSPNFILTEDVKNLAGYNACDYELTTFALNTNNTTGTLVFRPDGTFDYTANSAVVATLPHNEGSFTYDILCNGAVYSTKTITLSRCVYGDIAGISGIQSVELGNTYSYSVVGATGNNPQTYQWLITDVLGANTGVILSGQGTNTITAQFSQNAEGRILSLIHI